MKNIITLLLVLTSFISFSQVEKVTDVEEKIIYFSIIEKVPIYPGCKGDNTALRRCIQKKISNHLSRKFNSDLAENLDLKPGRIRMGVTFNINKKGLVEIIEVRAPHLELKKEVKRVIKLLPQMEAGESNGEKVSCRYSIPILFTIDKDISSNNKEDNDTFLYHIVDKKPVPSGCKDDKNTLQNCTNKKIRIYLSQKIKLKFLKKLNFTTGRKSLFIQFVIDEKGFITNIDPSISPWPDDQESATRMKEEVLRVLKFFPQIKPAEYKEKKVKVLFDLSINFNFKKGKINRKKFWRQ